MNLNIPNIPNVVGRRWGARGGGRYGAFGGFDGGAVFYGYPWFATEEIVELSPGVPVRIMTRPRAPTLLAGTGRGRRDRELADLGALIAPGSNGLAVQCSLGADGRLHASICIDGECYQGAVDLSAVLDRITDCVASHHAALHASPPHDVAEEPAAVEGTASAANAAVDVAGDLLVGALLDQHSATVSAGWWHSLTHAISDVHRAVNKTIQKFKTPITIAATAVASVYGGPAGGAAAARFTGPIIDAVASDGHASKDAKAVVDAAHAAAHADPAVAKALADAHKAVADTAAAYHLTATAAEAAGGDADAARKLTDLDRAASSGDAAAQRAMSVITQAFSTAADNAGGESPTASGGLPVIPFALGAAAGIGGYAWWRHHHARAALRSVAIHHGSPAAPPEPPPGAASAPGPSSTSTSGELIGAAIATLRSAAVAAVVAAYEPGGDTALGYLKDAQGVSVRAFPSLDAADDWFGGLDPRHYLYAAYFDAADPTWPGPINEQLGGPAAASAHAHVSGGLL